MMGLAMLTVGSTVVASKLIGITMPPFMAATLRFAVALPILLILMRVTRTEWPQPDRHDLLLLVFQALAGSAGYTALLIYGTERTSAADAGIILGALPAVAALISFVLLRDRMSRAMVIAIILASVGVVITAIKPGSGSGSLLGNALVLAAVVCEGLFILLNKRLRTPLPALAMATTMCGFGLALSLLPAVAEALTVDLQIGQTAIAGAIYYGLVPTVAGFWLWYAGSARAKPSDASLMTSVAPISAVLMSAAMFGDRLDMLRLIGLLLVVAAIIVASFQGKEHGSD